MAKSTRSKVKRAFRAKKRTEGVYAAVEAARLQRLNAKLLATTTAGRERDNGRKREEGQQDTDMPAVINHIDVAVEDADANANADMISPTTTTTEGVDGKVTEKTTGKFSTHGPRGSRRERWRTSKGMTPRPKTRGMNKQGTVAARYKPGRSHRRR